MGLFKKYSSQKQIFNWIRRGVQKLPQKAAGLYKETILDPQKEMNLELADHTYNKNLEMWNLQNEYNSPANQRKRMEEAGFNPNMFAGGGSSSAGNASSLPSYNVQAPTVNPMDFYGRIIQAANGLMNLRLGLANIRKTESQAGKLGTEGSFLQDTYGDRVEGVVQTTRGKATQASLGQQLLQHRGGFSDVAGNDYVNPSGMLSKQRTALDQTIQNQKADLVFKQYRNELAKYGIYSSDNFMFRMGIQALDTIGLDPSSWLKSGSEGLSGYLKSKR